MKLLKQSTAISRRFGPFISSTDGNTAMTSLEMTSNDIKLSKAGGAFAVKNEATAPAVSGADGFYTINLDVTDTNTLGTLEIFANVTGALFVSDSFSVVSAAVYELLLGTTDLDARLDTIDTAMATIQAKTDNLPSGIKKNVALSNLEFYLQSNIDAKLPATGQTVTAQISKDGGALAACNQSVTELSAGLYVIDLIQTEMNADVITLVFTASGAVQKVITIVTN